jgi:hypothetical protein
MASFRFVSISLFLSKLFSSSQRGYYELQDSGSCVVALGTEREFEESIIFIRIRDGNGAEMWPAEICFVAEEMCSCETHPRLLAVVCCG